MGLLKVIAFSGASNSHDTYARMRVALEGFKDALGGAKQSYIEERPDRVTGDNVSHLSRYQWINDTIEGFRQLETVVTQALISSLPNELKPQIQVEQKVSQAFVQLLRANPSGNRNTNAASQFLTFFTGMVAHVEKEENRAFLQSDESGIHGVYQSLLDKFEVAERKNAVLQFFMAAFGMDPCFEARVEQICAFSVKESVLDADAKKQLIDLASVFSDNRSISDKLPAFTLLQGAYINLQTKAFYIATCGKSIREAMTDTVDEETWPQKCGEIQANVDFLSSEMCRTRGFVSFLLEHQILTSDQIRSVLPAWLQSEVLDQHSHNGVLIRVLARARKNDLAPRLEGGVAEDLRKLMGNGLPALPSTLIKNGIPIQQYDEGAWKDCSGVVLSSATPLLMAQKTNFCTDKFSLIFNDPPYVNLIRSANTGEARQTINISANIDSKKRLSVTDLASKLDEINLRRTGKLTDVPTKKRLADYLNLDCSKPISDVQVLIERVQSDPRLDPRTRNEYLHALKTKAIKNKMYFTKPISRVRYAQLETIRHNEVVVLPNVGDIQAIFVHVSTKGIAQAKEIRAAILKQTGQILPLVVYDPRTGTLEGLIAIQDDPGSMAQQDGVLEAIETKVATPLNLATIQSWFATSQTEESALARLIGLRQAEHVLKTIKNVILRIENGALLATLANRFFFALKYGSSTTKEETVQIMGELAHKSSNNKAICAIRGMFLVLVELMQSGPLRVKAAVALTIFHLAANTKDNIRAVPRMLPTLLELINLREARLALSRLKLPRENGRELVRNFRQALGCNPDLCRYRTDVAVDDYLTKLREHPLTPQQIAELLDRTEIEFYEDISTFSCTIDSSGARTKLGLRLNAIKLALTTTII